MSSWWLERDGYLHTGGSRGLLKAVQRMLSCRPDQVSPWAPKRCDRIIASESGRPYLLFMMDSSYRPKVNILLTCRIFENILYSQPLCTTSPPEPLNNLPLTASASQYCCCFHGHVITTVTADPSARQTSGFYEQTAAFFLSLFCLVVLSPPGTRGVSRKAILHCRRMEMLCINDPAGIWSCWWLNVCYDKIYILPLSLHQTARQKHDLAAYIEWATCILQLYILFFVDSFSR